MHNLYPLKFNSIYKEKIWGGYRLRTFFGRDIPANKRIGESWEIADHEEDTTTIKNGPLAGKTLHDIVTKNGTELLGKKRTQSRTNKFVHATPTFPLLVKLIDTNDTLSVQVHPDDEYAQKHEGRIPAPCHSEAQPKNLYEQGKMEAWYIIHAEPGARIVHGFIPGTTVEDVKKLLKAGSLAPLKASKRGERPSSQKQTSLTTGLLTGLEECLNFITVKAGDVIFIPPGMVHTIGAGILLLEVSQNSDVTYRLFDWNRLGEDGKPRPLHIEKALDVIQVRNAECGMRNSTIRNPQSAIKKELLLECPKFSLELLEFEKYIEEQNNTDSFHILTVIKGEGSIRYGDNKKDFVNFSKGESILIPASLKSYEIQPSNACKVIKTSPP